MKIDFITVGSFMENTYFIMDKEKGECLVIDPGGDGEEIIKFLDDNQLTPVKIINTHGHIDHVQANDALREKFPHIPVLMHPADGELFGVHFDEPLSHGQLIPFAGQDLKIISAPGHTPGSVCILTDNFMLTGDTLFAGSIGRTDLGGSPRQMEETLRSRFNEIPGDMVIYPGHGEKSTMDRERKTNHFLILAREGQLRGNL